MRRMLIVALTAVMVLTVASLGRAGGEKGSLQGRWILVSTLANGKEKKDSDVKTTWTFAADGKAMNSLTIAGKTYEQKWTYKVDNSQNPRALDTRKDKDKEDKEMKMIYEVTGDTLKMGWSFSFKERPKSFEAAQVVWILKREAK